MKQIRAMIAQRKRVMAASLRRGSRHGTRTLSGAFAVAVMMAVVQVPLDARQHALQAVAGLGERLVGAARVELALGLEAYALAVDPLGHAAGDELVEDRPVRHVA